MTRRSLIRSTMVLVWLLPTLSGCRRSDTNYLDIATTTSVQNSGLMEALLPQFHPAVVRVHAVGSGLALKMPADRTVDLAISHAPSAETRYFAEHRDWEYRKMAFNNFVVIGPLGDPASIRNSPNVGEAFRPIASSGSGFVSRGDRSGTDEREQALWKEAGVSPRPERRFVSGASMAVTLRQADERQAYTLSDDATFRQLANRLAGSRSSPMIPASPTAMLFCSGGMTPLRRHLPTG
jgi:tungstate transport system substrate-binding protein